ncbi:hypothetical protein LEP1GSC096_0001 [Leptospira interrogans serovar Hebdomadis str. R499]|nr:hypothetical protein LEP1GSC096_0001 [Leptospira interrogans serovar Hebdomadis str. R499]
MPEDSIFSLKNSDPEGELTFTTELGTSTKPPLFCFFNRFSQW